MLLCLLKVWAASCCASALRPLRDKILLEEQEQVGNVMSNVGGWQSKPGTLDGPDPNAALVRMSIYQFVAQYVSHSVPPGSGGIIEADLTTSWANVNRLAHMNRMHSHGGYAAGVYYIDTPSNESMICFYDPRGAARQAGMAYSNAISAGWMETETMWRQPLIPQ